MTWLSSLFRCGKMKTQQSNKTERERQPSQLVSEITRTGESPGESAFGSMPKTSDDGSVTISVRKSIGKLLGLKLFYHSLQVQSIEPDTALSQHSASIPAGSTIISVNGKCATTRNIRNLLRECRYLPEVYIVIQKQGAPRQGLHRLSNSSATGSGSHISPSPSQLSSMWRRASETATLPVSDSGALPVPIDFDKLSRDSMGMWTRGIVRDSSLPDLQIDSLEADIEETPNSWRARRRVKRASWSGTYPEAQET